MELRTLGCDGVLVVELRGSLDVGYLYDLARFVSDQDLSRFGKGRIYDMRGVESAPSVGEQVEALGNWMGGSPHPDHTVVFVSARAWAIAANRIVRRMLDLRTWHVVENLQDAFGLVGLDADEKIVARRLAVQAPVYLGADDPPGF